jgi:bifunctional non-homologous end joining protein LigD
MWRKIKHRQRAELVICGFTKHPTSILVGIERDGELKFTGQVKSGFSRQEVELVQDARPFARRPRTKVPAKCVKPVLIAEVAFQDWTSAGLLRHPSFVGVRCLA